MNFIFSCAEVLSWIDPWKVQGKKISLGKRHMNKYNYRIIVSAQLILLFDRLKFSF